MYRKLTIITAVLAMCLFASASAIADPTVVDQYTEGVPTAGGEKPGNEIPETSVGGGNESSTVGSGSDGPSGGGVESGQNSGSDAGAGSGDTGSGNVPAAAAGGESAPVQSSGTNDESSDDGGMGLLFPLILVGTLALVGILIFMRRRDDTGSRTA